MGSARFPGPAMAIDVSAILLDLYRADAAKYFDDPALGTLFDPPFAAVASASDPWFDRFKGLIGPFHWTPQEALGQVSSQAVARSVVSWCLPVAEAARQANRKQKQLPSRSWAYVRTFGEEFVTRLRHGLASRLRALGFAAVAPAVDPRCDVQVYPQIGISSRWSERHVGFVAGLGTFGLSGGLITRRGIAHRLGSVVTGAEIAPTSRPYGDDAFAWCLKTSHGTCAACAGRCPVGSIGQSVESRRKDLCYEHYSGLVSQRGRDLFGWEGIYGCGLCQTGVPCENCNPTERLEQIRGKTSAVTDGRTLSKARICEH